VSGREERKEIESCAFLGMDFFLLELNANALSAPREIFWWAVRNGAAELGLERIKERRGSEWTKSPCNGLSRDVVD
jgi:hypothetical protein